VAPGTGGSQSGGGNSGNGGGGGSNAGTGGSLFVDLDASYTPAPPDTRKEDVMPDTTGCTQDDAGNYLCCPEPLSILSLGQPAKYGAGSGATDNTGAFQAFMNGNTRGTATMVMQTTKPNSIAELGLSKYNVIILQALYTSPYDPNGVWTFTDADAATLRDWVTNTGGAIIALSGYFGDTAVEIPPLNQLLNGADHWSGISYNTDDTFPQSACPDNLCYCSNGSIPFDGWQTTCAECAAITVNHDGSTLGKVGIFRGRSINCTDASCQVFAKNATYGNVGVAKIIGSGRVLAWSDEWVTYTSQWGLTPDPVYDDAVKYNQCVGHTAMTSFVVPQFWYNVFRWAAPGNTCFTIEIPKTANPVQQIVY
jgi:hypothetical protein